MKKEHCEHCGMSVLAHTDEGAETFADIAECPAMDEKTHGRPMLMRYSDATTIRPATSEEQQQSMGASLHDGGAGIITVDGVDCYVAD